MFFEITIPFTIRFNEASIICTCTHGDYKDATTMTIDWGMFDADSIGGEYKIDDKSETTDSNYRTVIFHVGINSRWSSFETSKVSMALLTFNYFPPRRRNCLLRSLGVPSHTFVRRNFRRPLFRDARRRVAGPVEYLN